MVPEAPVVEVRRRRSRAGAEQLVAQHEASVVSPEEFCRQHGLSLATLARYRKRRRAPGEAAGAGRWLAVELCDAGPAAGNGAATGLAVRASRGRRIEIQRCFDAPTLVQFLELLERP